MARLVVLQRPIFAVHMCSVQLLSSRLANHVLLGLKEAESASRPCAGTLFPVCSLSGDLYLHYLNQCEPQ